MKRINRADADSDGIHILHVYKTPTQSALFVYGKGLAFMWRSVRLYAIPRESSNHSFYELTDKEVVDMIVPRLI